MQFSTIVAMAALAFGIASATPVTSLTTALKGPVKPTLPAQLYSTINTTSTTEATSTSSLPIVLVTPRPFIGPLETVPQPMPWPFRWLNYTLNSTGECRLMFSPNIILEHFQPCLPENIMDLMNQARNTKQPRQALIRGPNDTVVPEAVASQLTKNIIDVFELVKQTIAMFKLMQDVRNLTDNKVNSTLAFDAMIHRALNGTSPAEMMVKDFIRTLVAEARNSTINATFTTNKPSTFSTRLFPTPMVSPSPRPVERRDFPQINIV